jgi:hypothetical protein
MFKALLTILAVGSISIFAASAPKTVVEKVVKADTIITVKVDTIKTVRYDTLKITKTLKDTSILVKTDTAKVSGKSVIVK